MTTHLAAVSEVSVANGIAIFATQLLHSFLKAQKPSRLSDKSTDRKHVTYPQVKQSYLEEAGNLPPAAAWRWKGRISSQTGHAFLGPLFLGGCLCLTSFLSCAVTWLRSFSWKSCRNTSTLLQGPHTVSLGFSLLMVAIARVFPRAPPMKHHLWTWRYFHRPFRLMRFHQSLVPSVNVQECNRLYITSVRSLYTDRGGLLCPYFIGVNLSPAPSAVKSADLYPIAFPFHSCRRVGHPPGCILLSHVAPGTGGDFTTTGAFSSET